MIPRPLAVLARCDMPARYLDSENHANDAALLNTQEIATLRELGLHPGG